jgi:uncharacterized protein
MRVLLSGASGLIGSALVRAGWGDDIVLHLVRRPPGHRHEIQWDPEAGFIDPGKIDGVDTIIHLAGEPLARGRWSRAKKARIRDSRVNGTLALARAAASLSSPPAMFLSASATGIYGDRGDELLDEKSPIPGPGDSFLADVCREWEEAMRPATDAGIRTVQMRFGVVLSAQGGALKAMLRPFRLGLGGAVGTGEQYVSWIALDDAVAAVRHLLHTRISGPVNIVAPEPIRQIEFAGVLARALRRPTLVRTPKPLLRLALGQLADEAVLASQRVLPRRLVESHFAFRYPNLRMALEHLLGSPDSVLHYHGPGSRNSERGQPDC